MEHFKIKLIVMAIQKNNFRRKFITQSLLIDSISYQLKNLWMFIISEIKWPSFAILLDYQYGFPHQFNTLLINCFNLEKDTFEKLLLHYSDFINVEDSREIIESRIYQETKNIKISWELIFWVYKQFIRKKKVYDMIQFEFLF